MAAITIDRAGQTLAEARPFYRQLYVQVLVAIFFGALIGHFWPATGEALKPLGDAFIKLVKMIIAPVIFLTIVTGLSGMGSLRGVGSVVTKAFGYFLSEAAPFRSPDVPYFVAAVVMTAAFVGFLVWQRRHAA